MLSFWLLWPCHGFICCPPTTSISSRPSYGRGPSGVGTRWLQISCKPVFSTLTEVHWHSWATLKAKENAKIAAYRYSNDLHKPFTATPSLTYIISPDRCCLISLSLYRIYSHQVSPYPNSNLSDKTSAIHEKKSDIFSLSSSSSPFNKI